MKYRWLFVHEDYTITGTNDEAIAREMATYDNMLCVETEQGITRWGGEDSEIHPIEEQEAYSEDAEEEKNELDFDNDDGCPNDN